MRKIATIGMIAFIGALALTSCKKNYTCSCHIYAAGDTSGAVIIDPIDTTYTIDYSKTTKSKAKSGCDDAEKSANAAYQLFGASATCNL